jgi:gliding motility-associated-like protein
MMLKVLYKNMLKKLLVFSLLAIGLLVSNQSLASHVSGGSIKYKALGNNRFYIEVAVFRDCSGIQYSAFTATVTAQCMPSGTPTNHVLNHLAFVAPTPKFGGPYGAITFAQGNNTFSVEEVSDVCDKVLNPSQSPNTRCRGAGSILGYTRFKYSGIITLTACNYWRLGFVPQCCRNTGNSNITTGSMYVETRFDSRNFPNNSAPDFADEVKPIPSACVGKEVKYGIGTVDHDGDSLRFEVACAMGSVSSCATYRSGFTATNPADSFRMDSATGLIRFVPKTAGKRVVAFWVKEYERCTGKWKAQTLRDVQFRVEACNNNIPKDISGVSNVQNGQKLGPYKIQVCNGMTLSFEDTIYDKDVTDTLVFQSNHSKVLPGSQMSVTSLAKNKAVVRFTWRASVGKNPVKIFYLVYNDDRCNYPGNGFSVFEIEVKNSTNAGADITVCKGDTAIFSATGGAKYEWTSIWGDSLIWSGPNRNVWGDTTAKDTNKTLKFLATQTTFLQVWSDLNEGCVKATACKDRDSVKIRIARDYNILKHNDTTICFNDSTIQIWAKADSAHSTYSYKWTPSDYMQSDSVWNPFVTPIESRYFKVTVTSDSGCIREDSILVSATPPFPPNIKAFASDTFVCQGTKTNLDLNLGHVPTSCGLSKAKCVGAAVQKQFGTDTTATLKTGSASNAVQMWPTPYGNSQASAKMQFLILNSEMAALNMTSGLINGIGFEVKEIGGVNKYDKFTIKMKCTNSTQLAAWEFGLAQVFSPKTITIQKGWNYHQFDVPYDYLANPGNNLVIEICFENTSISQNSSVYYSNAGFNACLVTYGSGNQCSSQGLSQASRTNRPNIRLEYCKGPNPKAYSYQWVPSKYLSSDTIKNPVATVLDTVTYYAIIKDTLGKCTGTSNTVSIDLSKIEIGRDTALCPYDTVQVSVNPKVKCSGPKSYKWIASNSTAYISNDTIGNPFLMATQNTSFQLTFKDTCGCTIVDTFNITMRKLPNPTVTRTPPSCGLDNGQLTISGVGGISPYKYNLNNLLNNQADSNTTGSFTKLNNGYYELKVTDAGKCFVIVRDTFTNTAPIIDSILTKDLTCYKQGDGEIDVYASEGLPPLTYSIDSGSTWVSSSQFRNLVKGNYNIMARSRDGCITKPIKKFIDQPDSLFASLYYTEVSCNGAADAQAIAVPQGGTVPYRFNWANGAMSDTAKGLSGGPDSLLLTDDNGCTYVRHFNILEYPEVVIDSVKFRNISCYEYDDGQIEIYARGGKQAVFYSVNQGGTYSSFSKFGGLEPKGYGIRVKDVNGCEKTDTVTLIEPKEVEVFTNFDSTKICVSNCADLLATARGGNGVNYDFHWTPNITSTAAYQRVCPDGNSKYWVYAKDTVGCISKRKEVFVEFYDSLKVYPSENKTICKGQEVVLPTNATGGDGTGYNYWWLPPVGIDNPNSAAPTASPDSTQVYFVVVGDNCGSPYDTGMVTVNVLPLPEIDFMADTTFVCNPGSVIFKNNSKSIGVSCVWDMGTGETWESCNEAPYIYRYPGNYDVKLTLTDAFGCTDSLTKTKYIEVARTPIPYFDLDPKQPTILQPEVQFTDRTKGNIVEWYWNFAGFATSEEQHPLFSFPETHKEKYPVKLTVTDKNTCEADTTILVFVGPEFSFYIPKAFTPNGDGLNDVWRPVGNGVNPERYEMIIFNRWGQIIFRTTDFNEGWDGRHQENGELVEIGTYPYKIRVGDTFEQREEHIYRGTVTIYSSEEEK